MATSSNLQPISGSGSNRRYSREVKADGTSVIRVDGTSREENNAFIVMARHFRQLGLPVPEVLDVSRDEMSYTQSDLGDTLLFDYIAHGRTTGEFSAPEMDVLEKTLRALAHIQTEGAVGLDWSVCYPVSEFDRRSICWDLNYWKYCFLKGTRIEFSESRLEDDFERLTLTLLQNQIQGFMYRDCQSRNVMVVPAADGYKPYFIDFQGGRKGPVQYDVASFLWQAKAHFSDEVRNRLIEAYLDEQSHICLQQGRTFDRTAFSRTLPYYVLFRTLQVLGAYGYRGLFEHKAHFIESIPYALCNLQRLFEQHTDLQEEYPYIYEVSQRLQTLPLAVLPAKAAPQAAPALLVTVYSFSFRKGIPVDESGNGGGYVFDCRSTHNPGKYEQYKMLTGRDKPVIDFLEQDGEIVAFLDNVYALVDHHVERFIERGFTRLQICFGCTGGQHRSVYSAEATAHHLHDKYGIQVHLVHREQHIEEMLS